MYMIKKSLSIQGLNRDIGLILCVVFLLNIDRLVLGDFGLLRQLDVSNMYLNKIMFLSNYWMQPVEYGWDSSILRGWPAEIGSITPNYYGVLIATILPIEFVYPTLNITIDFLVFLGAFLFIYCFLGYTRTTAYLGSILFLSINYWYNENPIATAAPLLPLLVSVTTFGKKPINGNVRLISMMLITSLSFPPMVLPIMPFVHFLVILVFFERSKFKHNIICGLAFWSVFALFHSVSLWGYWQNIGLSNRALWEEEGQSSSFINTFISNFNQTVLFPALMIFSLLTRKTLKPVIYAVGIILAIIGIIALDKIYVPNDLIENYSTLKILNFFYLRMLRQIHNFIGLAIFLSAVIILKEFVLNAQRKRAWLVMGFCLLTIISVIIYLKDGAKTLYIHFVCSSVILGSLYFYKEKYFQKILLTFLFLIIALIPFRVSSSLKYEQFYQGNLFLDPFSYETNMKAFRVATIMDDHWDHEFFQAQASIKGLETFGGMSVFYDLNDARLWQKYVAEGTSSLMDKYGYSFKNWNNRIDLVKADFEKNSDRVIYWMKLNNVLFVRSRQRIVHNELKLVEEKTVGHRTKKTLLLGAEPNNHQYYLYKFKSPISRVFNYKYAQHAYDQEKQIKKNNEEINLNYVNNLDLELYFPGLIEFNSKTKPGEKIFISTNYSRDWSLYINDEKYNERLKLGLYNMMSIEPKSGTNKYKLVYENSYYKHILVLFFSIFLFFLIQYMMTHKFFNQKE